MNFIKSVFLVAFRNIFQIIYLEFIVLFSREKSARRLYIADMEENVTFAVVLLVLLVNMSCQISQQLSVSD